MMKSVLFILGWLGTSAIVGEGGWGKLLVAGKLIGAKRRRTARRARKAVSKNPRGKTTRYPTVPETCPKCGYGRLEILPATASWSGTAMRCPSCRARIGGEQSRKPKVRRGPRRPRNLFARVPAWWRSGE